MSAPATRIPREGDPLILEEDDFQYFREVIRHFAGIHLSASKRELVQSRLRARVLNGGFGEFSSYRHHLQGLPVSSDEWQAFINLLTTNKTEFFREIDHFDFLREKFLPAWLSTYKGEGLRVWCAASSTGEEPYTLAMVLSAHLPPEIPFEIVSSDIDTLVLGKAREAVYSLAKLAEVPEGYRRFFDRGTAGITNWIRVKPAVKSHVTFYRHNLTDETPPPGDGFDLVFCRNVLIYFSPETITHVARKIHSVTKSGGLLVVGHSESLQNAASEWIQVRPSIYRK